MKNETSVALKAVREELQFASRDEARAEANRDLKMATFHKGEQNGLRFALSYLEKL